MPDVERNRIQLSLINGSTHEIGQDYYSVLQHHVPADSSRSLEGGRSEARSGPRSTPSMDMGRWLREAQTSVEARMELHNRLVLPPACLLLALIGVPLGLSSRKGGKSSAFVLTVIVAFLYYMGLVTLIGLARQQTLPVGDRDVAAERNPAGSRAVSWSRAWNGLAIATSSADSRNALQSVYSRFAEICRPRHRQPGSERLPIGPQIIDNYVLTGFLFYFGAAAGQLRTDDACLSRSSSCSATS